MYVGLAQLFSAPAIAALSQNTAVNLLTSLLIIGLCGWGAYRGTTTVIDSADPAYGSGSRIGSIGLVAVIGVGLILLGVAIMMIMSSISPAYFKGETMPSGEGVVPAIGLEARGARRREAL